MKQENPDPVVTCIEALQTATNKENALEQAKIAHKIWRVVDATDKNLSMDELKDLLNVRSYVFATVAAVYIWNKCYTNAYEIEDEFLYNDALWTGDAQQAIDIYLMQLIIEKQTDHLKTIFEHEAFRNTFLHYEDVYLSIQNPNYEFRSNNDLFVTSINRLNNYCRLLTGDKLI